MLSNTPRVSNLARPLQLGILRILDRVWDHVIRLEGLRILSKLAIYVYSTLVASQELLIVKRDAKFLAHFLNFLKLSLHRTTVEFDNAFLNCRLVLSIRFGELFGI